LVTPRLLKPHDRNAIYYDSTLLSFFLPFVLFVYDEPKALVSVYSILESRELPFSVSSAVAVDSLELLVV